MAGACWWIAAAGAVPTHGVALYGDPKYPAGFTAFDYVNPDAPRGGVLRQAAYGAFDTLNPFVLNGIAPAGIGLTHDTLMKSSADEPFTLYGLIADEVDISPDRTRVAFHINPRARFSDGSPITADDVVFSFERLRDQGVPAYRAYYRDVARVETPDSLTVVFHLGQGHNRELPLILGELPVLSRAWWQGRDFTKTDLDIPVSSGPYRIQSLVPGRSIVYRKNPDYWARDLNVNRGMYNFDEIRYDVYRDTTVAVEALKAGLIDVRFENEAKKWDALNQSEAVRSGALKARIFPHQMPAGMQGFVYNLRRPIFQDIRVRQALARAFDFDWTNRHLFYGAYRRTGSFFENAYLKATGKPSAEERAVMEPLRKDIPAAAWDALPRLTSESDMRQNLGQALALLKQAGWQVDRRGVLRNKAGQPFRFEILLDAASGMVWERVVLPFTDRLSRLGIQADIRTVDSIQYKNRLDSYDYDMIVAVWGQSFSPGNEQRYFWGSAAADTPGSLNYAGVKNPAVDALIEKIVAADTQAKHLAAVQTLDRVLLSLNFVIPHWYTPEHRYFYRDRFGMPSVIPMKGTDVLWWWQAEKKTPAAGV